MNTQKEVFNKLFKEDKTELATQKVELALVDDAKKIKGEYASIDEDSYFSFVVKAEVEGEKVINDYKQLLKKVESITPKLESAINELGINRNNFQVLDDLDSVKSQLKERISIYMTLEDKEDYTQAILNDYFQLKNLLQTIQKYDSKEDFVLKEIEEFETISAELDKIIN